MLGQEFLMETLMPLSKERLLFPVFFLLQAFLFLSTQFTLKGCAAVKETCSDMPRLSLCPAEGIACMSKNRSCLKLVVNRIGRSGRFGRKGVAINFVKSDDIRILRDIAVSYTHLTLPTKLEV